MGSHLFWSSMIYISSFNNVIFHNLYPWKPSNHSQSSSHSRGNWTLIWLDHLLPLAGWHSIQILEGLLYFSVLPHHWMMMNGCDPLTLTDDLDSFGCCRYSLNYCISPAYPCLIYWTCVNCKQYGNLLSSPSERGKIFFPRRDSNPGPSTPNGFELTL